MQPTVIPVLISTQFMSIVGVAVQVMSGLRTFSTERTRRITLATQALVAPVSSEDDRQPRWVWLTEVPSERYQQLPPCAGAGAAISTLSPRAGIRRRSRSRR